MHDNHSPHTPTTGVAVIGGAAVAVVCCATAPLLVAMASSLALGTVLGVGAGLAALGALAALAIGARRGRTPAVSPRRKDKRA